MTRWVVNSIQPPLHHISDTPVETTTRCRAPIRESALLALALMRLTCARRCGSGTHNDACVTYSELERASISLALAPSLLFVYAFTNKLLVPFPPLPSISL